MIEMQDAAIGYGSDLLLSGLTLRLAPGSFHFLTGPSGAGKTTFLKMCYAELLPTGGDVRIFGQPVADLSRDQVSEARQKIGVVHQDCQFLDHLPVHENIALPLTVTQRVGPDQTDDLKELVNWVGLGARATAFPPELSGGERQRAALARAIITDPDIILADEPTGNVDWEMSLRLLKLLVELNRMGKTILIATHDLALIRAAKQQVGARLADCGRDDHRRRGRVMSVFGDMAALLRGDAQADRVVPRTGQSARLTIATAGAMAFLAVFALALSVSAGRLADRWSDALARTSTVRLAAPPAEMEAQTWAVLTILEQTPGVDSARALTEDEQTALLEPWFGPALPLGDLPIPRLIEIVETPEGYDGDGLRLRLAAEVPGAVLDDHTRWRRPLVEAAGRLRLLGWVSLALILGSTAAMITLAAQSALAANEQVIRVLRLVGARDRYIARAFVRRFTLRAFIGGGVGTILGMVAILLLPSASDAGDFLTGLGFQGIGWAVPIVIPFLAAVTAFWATRIAAFRTLRGLP